MTIKEQERTRQKSIEIYTRSCEVIPGGVNSPVRSFPGLDQQPIVAESGFQEIVTDIDGEQYIDYCCSWGALIHGHAHPQIVAAAKRRVELGSSFGMATAGEEKLASLVVELVPWVEKIRFVSSGTEATMSAIRLARGFTGRSLILKFVGNYHGHADPFLVQAGSGVAHLSSSSSAGVPYESVQHTLCVPYNDCDACLEIFREMGHLMAAVIFEPIAANMGVIEPQKRFIDMLREECTKQGALLIFDEVITGFRVALGGAAEYFGIEPDLSCFGKIIGGGFPAAAVGGRTEIMDYFAPDGPVYQAGTLAGNPVAMEAGYQALLLCTQKDFYQILKEKTDLITDPIRALIDEKGLNLTLHQVGSMFTLFFGRREISHFDDVKACDRELFNHFFYRLFDRGIFFAPSQFEANFVSMAHRNESLLHTRDCILEILYSLHFNP